MKAYLVMNSESFDDAVKAHMDEPFESIEEAREAATVLLSPGASYYICDEQGGIFVVGKVPFMTGEC